MCQINIFGAFCLLTLNALHLSTQCVLIKVSYVEKVFLKGVNQGNIKSVASSIHVTNSDKKPLSQLIPNNHLNQCRLIINQVVSTVLPRMLFLILYQISEKYVCKCELNELLNHVFYYIIPHHSGPWTNVISTSI